MNRIILLIAAALVVASQAVAVPVECVHLGIVATYEPLTPGVQIRTTSLALGPVFNLRTVGVTDEFNGQKVGANESTPVRSTYTQYFRCTTPGGGGSLGAGSAHWSHSGNPSKLIARLPIENRVNLSLVNTGTALDVSDASGGSIVGSTTSWPQGALGSPKGAAVDFGGATVGATFDVRLSSDLQMDAAQDWRTKVDAFRLDIDITAAGQSEADRLVSELAALLGIDGIVLRQLLAALAVPQ